MNNVNNQEDLISNSISFPNNFNLTVIDMKLVYEQSNFSYGDRLSMFVIDWDKGIVHLEADTCKKENPFVLTNEEKDRDAWYKVADNKLKESFLQYGPTTSIEQQLATFYVDNMGLLAIKNSGSLEELVENSKQIAICEYGVESRLWIKDQAIPVLGNWCIDEDVNEVAESELYNLCGIPIPHFILDAYVLDGLFSKKSAVEDILSSIIVDDTILHKNEQKSLILHIKQRHDIIINNYNWFADYEVAELRHDSLVLYSKILFLVCEIDKCVQEVNSLPQNEIVVLSQLFGHIGKIIEAITFQKNIQDKDLASLRLSLEGMEFAFSEIENLLKNAIDLNLKNGFKVLKTRSSENNE